MLARGNENFRDPGENRTRDLPNSRSVVLTTEPPRLLREEMSEFNYVPVECNTLLLWEPSALHFCAQFLVWHLLVFSKVIFSKD